MERSEDRTNDIPLSSFRDAPLGAGPESSAPHPEEPRSGVSKDGGNTVLFSILRDAAIRPLLRMRSHENLDEVICLSSPSFKNIFIPF
jgi:hypothetical protein